METGELRQEFLRDALLLAQHAQLLPESLQYVGQDGSPKNDGKAPLRPFFA